MTAKTEESINFLGDEGHPSESRGMWARAYYKFLKDKVGLLSFAVVFLYFLIACGVWLGFLGAEWSNTDGDMWEPMSSKYWLGTNINGQSVWERAVFGTRIAFEVGMIVAICSCLIGGIVGALAGYYSGTIIDYAIMWVYGSLDAIPYILFVAAVGFALEDNVYSMHIAMIVTFWTGTCTLIRGEFIKIKSLEYVEAARAIGVPTFKIIFKHIMPNTFHLVLVQASLIFVAAIKGEVILSFLGLGIKEGVSWGTMLSESSQEVAGGILYNYIGASIFMFLLVLAFNLFADALQDALDPKKVS